MVLVVAMVLLPCLAFGASVSYSTSISVTGPAASFITATGVSRGPSNPPFFTNTFATLSNMCPSSGCDLTGTLATFTITFLQTLPAPGRGHIGPGTLTGTFFSSCSTGTRCRYDVKWSGDA